MESRERHSPGASPGNGRLGRAGRFDAGSLDGKAPTEAIKDIPVQLGALRVHAKRLLTAWARLAQAKLRLTVVRLALGAAGLVAILTATVTGTVLLLQGIAGGLAAGLGGRPWLGSLAAGAITVIAIGGGGWFLVRRVKMPRRPNHDTQREHRAREGRAPDRADASTAKR